MSKLPLIIALAFLTWSRVRAAPLQQVDEDEDVQVRNEEGRIDVDGDSDDEDYDSDAAGGTENSEENSDQEDVEEHEYSPDEEGGQENSETLDNVEERGNYFEGDMILPESYNGLKDKKYRWPDATVYYRTSRSFRKTEREVMRRGMELISSRTCIKFIRGSPKEKDYVHIVRGNKDTGCNAMVGRIGGKQNLNLEESCLTRDDGDGVVAHELMHALGFYHEQSRSDRDDYIIVDLTNVENGRESYFKKYPEGEVDSFGEPYDYGSLMHYRENAFAKDPNKPTIISKTKGMKFGQRKELSNADVRKLQRMYCRDKSSNDYENVDGENGDEDLTD